MIKPNISIIIPLYNVEQFIEKCLQSVFAQTHINYEVILVNDGSTDNSVRIVESMIEGDSRFKMIHQKNLGLSAARNTGLKEVAGEYVLYLDSDDALLTNALDTLYNTANKHRADVVQANFYYDYPDYLLLNTQQKEKEIVYSREEAMKALLIHKTVLNFAWGKLIVADLAKKHSFPEGKYFEDTFWKPKIIHDCESYVSLKEPLVYYLQRDSGISGEFSVRNLDQLEGEVERLHFLKKYYPHLVRHAIESLNSKLQQHTRLLAVLPESHAKIYRRKIMELQDQFCFQQKMPNFLSQLLKKLGIIRNKVNHHVFCFGNWKKIKKRHVVK